MKLLLTFLFVIFSFFTTQAQYYKSGSLTLKNKIEVKGKFIISTKNQSVKAKKDNRSYPFNQVENLSINDRLFTKETFNDLTYFTHELVSGKAKLFQIESNKYLIQIENGSFSEIDVENEPTLIRGILAVLFEDCNSIRVDINNVTTFSEKSLINLTTNYNSCAYGDFQPTETELKNANSFNTDQFKFYGGLGYDLKNINFYDNFYDEYSNQFGLKAGLLVSPGFTGNLQGNLYFYFDATFLFGSDDDFIFIDDSVQFSVNTYRMQLGIKYIFNKEGTINPFIGIGGGSNWDYYKGTINTDSFNIRGKNLIWAPTTGVIFKLKNGNDIGVTFEYIPEYKNDIGVPNEGEILNIDVNSSSLSFGLKYYF